MCRTSNDEYYLGHYHVSYSTAVKGASGRRFYVDLTPAKERMLLRKAKRYVNAPQNQLKETLLTNKLFQQFIDLVASSSKGTRKPIGMKPEYKKRVLQRTRNAPPRAAWQRVPPLRALPAVWTSHGPPWVPSSRDVG